MKKSNAIVCVVLALLLLGNIANAATEQAKQWAINKGLAWLATPANYSVSGSEVFYPYINNGTLAATGSAALAFIEEGYLPGADVIIDATDDGINNPVNYGDIVTGMCNYIFNRAANQAPVFEMAGYTRHAEDYNGNGILDDGGNNNMTYFNPGAVNRTVYTTGIVTPVVFALGEALGENTLVGRGTVAGQTYKQVLQDIIDWYSFAQVEPDRGVFRGGWRYQANEGTSDNSTAQWGSLPILYGNAWGLQHPAYVTNELLMWAQFCQAPDGGSGYTSPTDIENIAKTGGLLLEYAACGLPVSDPRVQAALNYISTHWNEGASGTWFGNLNHPYAMWAVYKGLEVYGMLGEYGPGLNEAFLIGDGVPLAPGGFTIGQDFDSRLSMPGDWYSHYSDLLVNLQNPDGSWNGYVYWTGALGNGWYINILNATGGVPPVEQEPIPEPLTMLGLLMGSGALAGYIRKRRQA